MSTKKLLENRHRKMKVFFYGEQALHNKKTYPCFTQSNKNTHPKKFLYLHIFLTKAADQGVIYDE
jgi:hypothetical protein